MDVRFLMEQYLVALLSRGNVYSSARVMQHEYSRRQKLRGTVAFHPH